MLFSVSKVLFLTRYAGSAILGLYNTDFDVLEKSDQSPITEADMAAHNILLEGLSALTPDIPVLSEESDDVVKQARIDWCDFWLVDPLDGTKEFINKNGEFTVNVALISGGRPVFGVVYQPVKDTMYWGAEGKGAFKQAGTGEVTSIGVSGLPVTKEGWRVVGSRSHQSDQFTKFIEGLPSVNVIAVGSSLKLCLVAEGKADLYPRFTPTSEWDIAAGHAVLKAAGGVVLSLPTLSELTYNTHKDSLINPNFMACAGKSQAWVDFL